VLMKEMKYKYGYIPDVIGMGLKDAVYILENAGLKVLINGKGKVVKQSLKAGSLSINGSIISIDLAKPSSTSDPASEAKLSDTTNTKLIIKDSTKSDTKNKSVKVKQDTAKIKKIKLKNSNLKNKIKNNKTPLKENKH